MSNEVTELAKFKGGDLLIDDHGFLMIEGQFDYEGGGSQGFGYNADSEFIRKFMRAMNATKLRNCNNQIVRVTHTRAAILRIAPIFDQGVQFDIMQYLKEVKEREKDKA